MSHPETRSQASSAVLALMFQRDRQFLRELVDQVQDWLDDQESAEAYHRPVEARSLSDVLTEILDRVANEASKVD